MSFGFLYLQKKKCAGLCFLGSNVGPREIETWASLLEKGGRHSKPFCSSLTGNSNAVSASVYKLEKVDLFLVSVDDPFLFV